MKVGQRVAGPDGIRGTVVEVWAVNVGTQMYRVELDAAYVAKHGKWLVMNANGEAGPLRFVGGGMGLPSNDDAP